MIPVADGTLKKYIPVRNDEVTRTPKMMRTNFLASVRAYTLNQTGLSGGERRTD